MKTAEILVCRNVPIIYTYVIPKEKELTYQEGMHVEVPFGNSFCNGIVFKIHNKNPLNSKLKSIGPILNKKPILSREMLDLIEWFSQYYQTTPYKAYQTIIGKTNLRELNSIPPNPRHQTANHKLTPEQNQAINTILSHTNHTFLLFGITSSGKTEVYLQAAKKIIQQGKRVMILLPEIALTPQMRRNFFESFGDDIAVIHSGLTPKEREIEWNKIYQDKVKIVIGPRSAVFTPLKNIGLIVLDEEHEPTYKQENHPRYQTHTVSEFRRAQNKAIIVYGSATPSLEQFYQASSQSRHLVSLTHRINNRPLPEVKIIDMKQEFATNKHILSKELIQSINENKKNKEKTMILLNRRGYASYISCQRCGTIHSCPQCNLSFTYHKDKRFRCHRCDISTEITHTCRKCGKNTLSYSGMGTQKVETELLKLFPDLKTHRLDRDAVKSAKAMEKVLSDFQKQGDVLLGTQMIAKGHHFETVTLVGVLGIDTTLSIPDFRSSERTFHLLTQVAGRAGRGEKPGKVLVQTFQPDHYVIEHAKTHDYRGFFQEEIKYREELWYPPFSSLINLIISSKNEGECKNFAQAVGEFVKASCKVQIIGPKPAPFEFVRGYYRWNVLLKCRHELVKEVKDIIKKIPKPKPIVRFIIDFDPWSVL